MRIVTVMHHQRAIQCIDGRIFDDALHATTTIEVSRWALCGEVKGVNDLLLHSEDAFKGIPWHVTGTAPICSVPTLGTHLVWWLWSAISHELAWVVFAIPKFFVDRREVFVASATMKSI